MSNFYPNNNIENIVFYGKQGQSINNHICFMCILVLVILFMIYDFYKNRKSPEKKLKSCNSCNKNKNINENENINEEKHNNLILKYETENFREIFNKSE